MLFWISNKKAIVCPNVPSLPDHQLCGRVGMWATIERDETSRIDNGFGLWKNDTQFVSGYFYVGF